jgi:hypothetical protein
MAEARFVSNANRFRGLRFRNANQRNLVASPAGFRGRRSNAFPYPEDIVPNLPSIHCRNRFQSAS